MTGEGGTDRATILAPLGITASHQKQGIGGKLIEVGAAHLTERGTELIFVLGWPDYYSRFGFTPAGAQGFGAPYPIDDVNADAWIVRELSPGAMERYAGTIRCADALDREELWRE